MSSRRENNVKPFSLRASVIAQPAEEFQCVSADCILKRCPFSQSIACWNAILFVDETPVSKFWPFYCGKDKKLWALAHPELLVGGAIMQSRVICFSFGQFLLPVPVEEATQPGFILTEVAALTVADDERNDSSQQRPVRLHLTPIKLCWEPLASLHSLWNTFRSFFMAFDSSRSNSLTL